MRQYNLVGVVVIVLILTIVTIPVFSQESQQAATNASAEISPAEEDTNQPEEISIYGEVQSANLSSNSITLQYYDYDSDEEKTIDIISDKDTKIENIASLNDLKQGDWVDATYSVSEGKSIAKSIKVEKVEEDSPEETLPEKVPGESMPKE